MFSGRAEQVILDILMIPAQDPNHISEVRVICTLIQLHTS
jgi:hypothetical protein